MRAPENNEPRSLDARQRAVVDEFKQALQDGLNPNIEDCVGQPADLDLLTRLVCIDLDIASSPTQNSDWNPGSSVFPSCEETRTELVRWQTRSFTDPPKLSARLSGSAHETVKGISEQRLRKARVCSAIHTITDRPPDQELGVHSGHSGSTPASIDVFGC